MTSRDYSTANNSNESVNDRRQTMGAKGKTTSYQDRHLAFSQMYA